MAAETLDYRTLDVFGYSDPASDKGRLRKVRARQAIVVIAADWLSRIFLLYTWAGRVPTSKYIDKIITVCETFKPRRFGIEANAMQVLFADAVRMEAKRRMKKLPIVAITQPTKVDKDFRIRGDIEPVLNDGRLFIQEKQIEMEAEIRGFPTGMTKDLVDSLSTCIRMVPKRSKRQQRSEEKESLARYLRESGAPSWHIQQRMNELSIKEPKDG